MKQRRNISLLILVALMLSVTVSAQNTATVAKAKTTSQKYMPFLTDESRPDATTFLPAPPEMMSSEFYNDYYYYQWGIQMRSDSAACALAVFDNGAARQDVFSEPFNLDISEKSTPEIMTLIERAVADVRAANTKAKNHFKRTRPFVVFKQPSLVPQYDEYVIPTYSYPSGHSCRGYMCAMVLSAVAPQSAEPLMSRARQYAYNRLICGHHWKSDIEASLMLASSVFAALVANSDFQQQLAKAQTEYREMTK